MDKFFSDSAQIETICRRQDIFLAYDITNCSSDPIQQQ